MTKTAIKAALLTLLASTAFATPEADNLAQQGAHAYWNKKYDLAFKNFKKASIFIGFLFCDIFILSLPNLLIIVSISSSFNFSYPNYTKLKQNLPNIPQNKNIN